jgi:AraC-like DNA-binding protein
MSSLSYIERRPPQALTPFIECFWIVHGPARRGHRPPDRVLPDGCPEWIVHVGDCFERLIGERWTPQPRCFLAGTLTRPWLIRGGAHLRTLGIRFKPGAAATLLDISLAGAADTEIELGDLSRQLTTVVISVRTTERMLEAAQRLLLSIAGPRLTLVPRTSKATARIRSTKGNVRIDALAASLGASRRTLERWFDTELGISPKQYARIVRFNAVLSAVAENERAELVDLAMEAGFFDQAHLLLDARRLAGRALRRGAAADGELARHFTRPDRLRELLERTFEQR